MTFTEDMLSLANNSGQASKIVALFRNEPERCKRLDLSCGGIRVNLARNAIPIRTLETLAERARHHGFEQARQALFDGESINVTENRQVLHTLIRQNVPRQSELRQSTREQIASAMLALELESASDLLVIGMGGSILGPRLVNSALMSTTDRQLACHYIDNLDAHHLDDLLKRLNRDSTRVILISKSFTTQETLANGELIRNWFNQSEQQDFEDRAIAISSQQEKAEAFGFRPDHVIHIPQGIGGRFSIWSCVGLPIACVLGMSAFDELLDGAALVDRHFLESPLMQNIPFMLALVGVWYRNVEKSAGFAVVPYDDRLSELVPYLQQLDMESNGKRVGLDGNYLASDSGPLCFGGAGTGAQHAFFQWLHQGTSPVPVDFIGIRSPDHPNQRNHELLLMNMLSQSEALMRGVSEQEVLKQLERGGELRPVSNEQLSRHRAYPGNRSSNLILIEQLTPRTLGSLIAIYEHKVFTQGWMWGINSFDQWGVELGKQRCADLEADAGDGSGIEDAVTRDYLDWIRSR